MKALVAGSRDDPLASRNLHPLNGTCLRRAAILALVLGTVLPARGAAQDAPSGLMATDPGAAGLGIAGLRGTSGTDGDDTLTQPDAGAASPDQDDGKRPKLPTTVNLDLLSTAKARQGAPSLPPLAPYPAAAAAARPRGASIDTLDLARAAAVGVAPPRFGPTVEALPTQSVRRTRPDPTPFAPLGYTFSSIRLTPFVQESLGFDSNPDQVATRTKPSGFSRTEGGFDLLSLWSSNELRANVHGGYNEFFSDPAANRPDGVGTVDYRYDVSRDIALDTEGRFAITTQRPGSPELNIGVQGRPLISSFGASLGGSDTLGRLTLILRGTFDRTSYENGVLADGTVVRLDEQNFNAYGVLARAAYELSPALKPFVELRADTRVHDLGVDAAGYARDSNGVAALLGSSFELGRLITGEASAGYADRAYQDRRLRDLNGPLVEASLAYAVTPLTTLTLHAATSFDETTLAGSPGSESRSVSLQVSHALLRNLTLTGILGYLNTDYVGSRIVENTISGTLKASYNVTRSVVLDGSYNHEVLSSTVPASGFVQDVFMAGVRLQH